MRFLHCLVVLALVCAAILAAGCAQGTSPSLPSVPAATAAPGTTDPATLVLGTATLPPCFVPAGQHAKVPAEIGSLAKDLGWQAGYEATWDCPASGGNPTVLVQSIAIYPPASIPVVAAMADNQDRTSGYQYENITDPGRAVFASGFSAKARHADSDGTSPGSFVLAGGKNITAAPSGSSEDFAEIILTRNNVLEVLRMSGPGVNATVLHDIAGKAARTIP